MKLGHYTHHLLWELGYPYRLQIDTDPEEVTRQKITDWLSKRHKIEYEFLNEYHDRLIRGGTWRNVHKFTIRTSPTSSRSWSSRDFDKALQRVLFELKQESSPNAD